MIDSSRQYNHSPLLHQNTNPLVCMIPHVKITFSKNQEVNRRNFLGKVVNTETN